MLFSSIRGVKMIVFQSLPPMTGTIEECFSDTTTFHIRNILHKNHYNGHITI